MPADDSRAPPASKAIASLAPAGERTRAADLHSTGRSMANPYFSSVFISNRCSSHFPAAELTEQESSETSFLERFGRDEKEALWLAGDPFSGCTPSIIWSFWIGRICKYTSNYVPHPELYVR